MLLTDPPYGTTRNFWRTSLDYFRSPEAEPVLARIRNAGNVVHY